MKQARLVMTILSHVMVNCHQFRLHVNVNVSTVADDICASPQGSDVFAWSQSQGHMAQVQTQCVSPPMYLVA